MKDRDGNLSPSITPRNTLVAGGLTRYGFSIVYDTKDGASMAVQSSWRYEIFAF